VDNIQEKDGFYRLAKKILQMGDDSTIEWCLNDGMTDLGMGTTKKWIFDCDLLITSSYGGGFESILWLREGDISLDEIYKHFQERYKGLKFAGFIKDDM
jgi:hypothetical protein